MGGTSGWVHERKSVVQSTGSARGSVPLTGVARAEEHGRSGGRVSLALRGADGPDIACEEAQGLLRK